MKREIHQLLLFADNQLPPPIPPCAAELTSPECPTPLDVANLIVTPNWHAYVAWHLNEPPDVKPFNTLNP